MGWCSGTEIMDAVIEAVEDMLGPVASKPEQDERDEQLRPMVAKVADALRSHDWDCQDESDYYDRFRREMAPDAEDY